MPSTKKHLVNRAVDEVTEEYHKKFNSATANFSHIVKVLLLIEILP